MSRVLELLIVGLMIVIALPLVGIASLVVLVSLGRPLLFRQRRAGKGGVAFEILKLRTMSDARDRDGALLPDAERVTGASAVIRRIRVDELFQLFAILRGEMALVGPRPLMPETIEAYGDLGRRRCSVRPGLTGWAQVSGNVLLTDDEKLALDLWYTRHRSLLLDLRIIFETVLTVVFGEARRLDRIEAAQRGLARERMEASLVGGAS